MAISGGRTFKLGINVSADARQAIGELEKLSKGVNRGVYAVAQGLQTVAMGATAVTAAILTPFVLGSKAAINMTAEMENAELAFESMLGSAEKAKKLWGDLVKFSSKSPLPLDQLRDGAQLLLAFGHNADAIIPKIKLLGTVTKALNLQGGLSQAVRALEDLRAGSFNQMMLGNLGITRDLLSQRGIKFSKAGSLESSGAQAYEAAFKYLEDRFAKMADRADQLLSTRIGNIADKIRNQVLPAIGSAFAGAFGGMVDSLNDVIDRVIKALGDPRIRDAIRQSFETLSAPIKSGIDWLKKFADKAASDPDSVARMIGTMTSAIKTLTTTTLVLIGASVGARLVAWLAAAAAGASALAPIMTYLFSTTLIQAITQLNALFLTLCIRLGTATASSQAFSNALTVTLGGFLSWIAALAAAVASVWLNIRAEQEHQKSQSLLRDAFVATLGKLNRLKEGTDDYRAALESLEDQLYSYMQAEMDRNNLLTSIQTGGDSSFYNPDGDMNWWARFVGILKGTGIGFADIFTGGSYTKRIDEGSAIIETMKNALLEREKRHIKAGGTLTDEAGFPVLDSVLSEAKKEETLQTRILNEAIAQLGKATGGASNTCALFAGNVLEAATGVKGLGADLSDAVIEFEKQLKDLGFKQVTGREAGPGDFALWTPGDTGDGVNHVGILSSKVAGDKFKLISGGKKYSKESSYSGRDARFYRAPGGDVDPEAWMKGAMEYFQQIIETERQIEEQRYQNRLAYLKGVEKLNAQEKRLDDQHRLAWQAAQDATDPLEREKALLALAQIEGALGDVERERADIAKQLKDELIQQLIVEKERVRNIANQAREEAHADQESFMGMLSERVDQMVADILAGDSRGPLEAAQANYAKTLETAQINLLIAMQSAHGTFSQQAAQIAPFVEALKTAAQAVVDFQNIVTTVVEAMKTFGDDLAQQISGGNYGSGIMSTLNQVLGGIVGAKDSEGNAGAGLLTGIGTGIMNMFGFGGGVGASAAAGAMAGPWGMIATLATSVLEGFMTKWMNKASTWINRHLFGGGKKPVEVKGIPVVWVANFDQIARGFTLPASRLYSGRGYGDITVRRVEVNVNNARNAADETGKQVARAIYRALESGA